MSPENGSREPTTDASCRVLVRMERYDLWYPVDGRRDTMTAELVEVESEAVERFAEALVRAVEGGPRYRTNAERDASPMVRDTGGVWLALPAVLDAISALRSPADTGEHQEGDVGS